MKEEDNSIGKDLRRMRKEKGLTQIEVAERAGISVNSLRLYEAGKRTPRINHFKMILAVLGVDFAPDADIERMIRRQETRISLLSKIASALKIDPLDLERTLKAELGDTVDETFDDVLGNAVRNQHPSSENVHKILAAFDQLNPEGQTKAVERVEELTEIPKYQKQPPQD